MAGCKELFCKEVTALLPKLLGVARQLTRNETDAQDLVAETVVRAWRAFDSLQAQGALRAWMFRILHNTFISECRRAQARPPTESLDAGEDDEETEFSIFEQLHQPFLLWFSHPEQAFVDKLLREHIDRALKALPCHHRAVVVLADIEELGYAEIAEVVGVPVGTVRSRLARARCALQRLLWQDAREYGLRADVDSAARAARGDVRDSA